MPAPEPPGAADDAADAGDTRRLLPDSRTDGGHFAMSPADVAGTTLTQRQVPDPAATRSTNAVAPAYTPPPRTIPGYELLERLGEGGMGIVYRARQVKLNRVVALKILRGGHAAGRKELIRFLAEAEAVAAVRHPHVIHVYEFGEADGHPFLAMEYLAGGTLADRLETSGPLDPSAAAELVAILADAVQAAHDQGIVHRDLKPENVLYDAAGEPKVTDFGLAKRGGGSDLTATQVVMGTPAYMAPEQARGDTKFVTPSADVYSLGVILYECLTGSRPFEAPDQIALLRKVAEDDPEPPRRRVPRLPRDVELICLKCLAKNPAERYSTAADLAADLERFRTGKSVSVRAAGWVERGYRWARRRPYEVAATGLALLVVVLGGSGAAAAWLWREAEAGRGAAEVERSRAEASRLKAEGARAGEEAARAELAAVNYVRNVDLADREWLAGNLKRAGELLADCPPELRNWEWRYVHGLCNSHLRVIDPAVSTRVEFSSDGRWLTASGLGAFVVVRDARGAGEPSPLGAGGEAILWDKRPTDGRGSIPSTSMALAVTEPTAAGPRSVLAVPGSPPTLWDPVARREVARLTPTGKFKSANAVVAGGGLAATWLQGAGPIDVWDLATGAHRFAVPDRNSAPGLGALSVRGAAMSSDGNRLAVIDVRGTVRVWDTPTGRLQTTFPTGADYQNSRLSRLEPHLVFGRGGEVLAANTAAGVEVWEVATGRRLATLPLAPRTSNALAFSGDGRRLAALRDGLVHVWDAGTFNPIVTLRIGVQQGIALSPNGRRLFAVGVTGLCEWDATDDQRATTFRPEAARVTGARFTPDGAVVIRVVQAQAIVRNLTTGAEVQFDEPDPDDVRGHLISPDGRRVVRLATRNGRAELIEVSTGRRLCEFRLSESRTPPTFGTVAFSPDGRQLLSVGPDGTATTWDATTGGVVRKSRSPYPAPANPLEPLARVVHAVTYGPSGPTTVSSQFKGSALVWDPSTGAAVCELQQDPDVTRGVTEVIRFNPDGKLAVWDAVRVTQFDPATGRRLTPAVAGGSHLSFSPDGTRLVSARNLSVMLWDPATGRECLQIATEDFVRDLEFSPDGHSLLIADAGAVRIYRTGR